MEYKSEEDFLKSYDSNKYEKMSLTTDILEKNHIVYYLLKEKTILLKICGVYLEVLLI